MRLSAVACLVMLMLLGSFTQAARILALFTFPSKSHFVMLEGLAKGLAARGHQVTVVGNFPQEQPVKNYRDISLRETMVQIMNNVSLDYIEKKWRSTRNILQFIWKEAGVENCERSFRSKPFQELLHSGEKFDLLIGEVWGTDCLLPVANFFDVPHISMITTLELPWSFLGYGNPINPAYQVSHFLDFSPRGLTFWQRVVNTLFVAYTRIGHYIYSEIPSDTLVKKFLGPLPHLSDIVKNSSLIFVNSHFTMTGSRPLMPNVIEVGGLHIQNVKPLPKVMKKLLDDAKEGVIIFSLGSMIRCDSLGDKVLTAFVEEFRRLPQLVLWKYNGTLPNQPKNVVTFPWLPQSDLLRHPNVRLFITHGGLMGTQEAITAGVPMLGIPFFADQSFNLKNYEEMGFAIPLKLENITPEKIRKAIHELLNNPRYSQNAKHFSNLFQDRPQTALETAIYWTEYVIRHNGAKHLRSSAVDLSFAEYHLLDVFAFLGFLAILTIFLLYKCVALLFGRGKLKND